MRYFLPLVVFILLVAAEAPSQEHEMRIKDIVNFEGVRDNLLIGYGLVTGLSGTGDHLRNSAFTQRELTSFLDRVGVNTGDQNIKTKNTAAVTVTATLPPFMKNGNRINITVSTLGDATSLAGGILLATTLIGADGEVYAVAQGEVAIAEADTRDRRQQSYRAVKTAGFISNGAIVEREIPFALDDLRVLHISLRNPDISTAHRISQVINDSICPDIAKADNPATVSMRIPTVYQGRIMELLTRVEQLLIVPENSAKIIIDEASGAIVIGKDVRISSVAIAQGNLAVSINDDIMQNDKDTSLQDLVNGLNALGVSTRDLIGILQNIKSIGALQGDIIVK